MDGLIQREMEVQGERKNSYAMQKYRQQHKNSLR